METNEWKQLYEQEIERIKNEVSDQQKILDKWRFDAILLTIDVLNSPTRYYKEQHCKTLLGHLRVMPETNINVIISGLPF